MPQALTWRIKSTVMRWQTLAIVQTYEMNIQNLKMCHKEAFVRTDPVADSDASRVILLLNLFPCHSATRASSESLSEVWNLRPLPPDLYQTPSIRVCILTRSSGDLYNGGVSVWKNLSPQSKEESNCQEKGGHCLSSLFCGVGDSCCFIHPFVALCWARGQTVS